MLMGVRYFSRRLEECELFNPVGVQMSVGGQIWEIFETGLRNALVEQSHETVRVNCPSTRVAEFLATENNTTISNGDLLLSDDPKRLLYFNGNNFGAMNGGAAEPSATINSVSDPLKRTRRIWIEGLIARRSGSEGVLWLRAHWNGETPPIVSETTTDTITWLQPHTHFARSQ